MNPDQNPPTITEELVTTIVHAPQFFAQYVVGLFIVLISEALVTTFALAAVAVGFATDSVLIGLAAFGVIYSLGRMVDMLCRVVAQSTGRVTQVMYQTAQQIPAQPNPADYQPVLIQPEPAARILDS